MTGAPIASNGKTRFPTDSPVFQAIATDFRKGVDQQDDALLEDAHRRLDEFAGRYGVTKELRTGRRRKQPEGRNWGPLAERRFRLHFNAPNKERSSPVRT
jgi:hypothetical protein